MSDLRTQGRAVSGKLSPPDEAGIPHHQARLEEEHELDKSPSPCERKQHVPPQCEHPKVKKLPIAEHGIVGNMHTSALVGVDGNIDFLCFPHFDSPTVFASILDDCRGGFFRISTCAGVLKSKQFYWPDTNILVSRFLSEDGVVQLVDFMPTKGTIHPWRNCVVRIVEGIRGNLQMLMQCFPSFDYATKPHQTRRYSSGCIIFESKNLNLALIAKGDRCGQIELEIVGGGVRCVFDALESYRVAFELRVISSDKDLADLDDQRSSAAPRTAAPLTHSCPLYDSIFHANVTYWKNWLSQCTYEGHWKEMVHRSALVLKLLTFEDTGAIISSPTFGLANTQKGFRQEAESYVRFLGARARQIQINHQYSQHQTASPLLPVYTIEGEPPKPERVLYHLGSQPASGSTAKEKKPVVVGNNAHQHLQLDIFGELMDALYVFNIWGRPISYDGWQYLMEMCDWVCRNWTRPDYSIWGFQDAGPRHNVYSKMMCWVAIDRALRLSDRRSFPLLTYEEAEREDIERASHSKNDTLDGIHEDYHNGKETRRQHWLSVRDEIYLDIMRRGWNPNVGAFVQSYGSNVLDASLMIMPLVFFLAPTDPRMLKTIDKINSAVRLGGLATGGLVKRFGRYNPEVPPLSRSTSDEILGPFPEVANPEFSESAENSNDEKVPEDDGTFNLCTFWVIEALARAGGERAEQARLLFEQMLTFGNHLGLFSEETSQTGQLMGNFPQALTHVTLISAAFNLSRTRNPSKQLTETSQ